MVLINKNEKEAITKRFGDVCIVRTMHGDSGRHKYYMEERRDAMSFLKSLRNAAKENMMGR